MKGIYFEIYKCGNRWDVRFDKSVSIFLDRPNASTGISQYVSLVNKHLALGVFDKPRPIGKRPVLLQRINELKKFQEMIVYLKKLYPTLRRDPYVKDLWRLGQEVQNHVSFLEAFETKKGRILPKRTRGVLFRKGTTFTNAEMQWFEANRSRFNTKDLSMVGHHDAYTSTIIIASRTKKATNDAMMLLKLSGFLDFKFLGDWPSEFGFLYNGLPW